MVEWATRFDCPIYLHAADRRVGDAAATPPSRFWDGETPTLGDGPDADPLRRPLRRRRRCCTGPAGAGALLTGDIIQVVPDRTHVSFMYSYPNLIPLPDVERERHGRGAGAVRVRADLRRLVGRDRSPRDGKDVVRRSAERYARALRGELPPGA